MRKALLILLSIGALLALQFLWQGPATAQDGQMQTPVLTTESPQGSPDGARPKGFGKKIGGTYLMWAEWDR